MIKFTSISACILVLALGFQNTYMQPVMIYNAFENVDYQGSNVNLRLFYESLCPYSIRFIVEQLYPVVMQYGRYMSLDLVPFGHSLAEHRKNGGWDFKCQHGQAECYGNRVHACVIDQGMTKSQEKTVEVLACLMHFNYTNQHIEKCLQKSNFDYYRHINCMRTKATDLEVAYGQRTMVNVPSVDYVPFIMFNGVHNNTLEEIAAEHLDYVVCSLIHAEQRPETCPHYNYI